MHGHRLIATWALDVDLPEVEGKQEGKGAALAVLRGSGRGCSQQPRLQGRTGHLPGALAGLEPHHTPVTHQPRNRLFLEVKGQCPSQMASTLRAWLTGSGGSSVAGKSRAKLRC